MNSQKSKAIIQLIFVMLQIVSFLKKIVNMYMLLFARIDNCWLYRE
ncbi:9306_t:CDS:2 [Acaulospora colombiana]|uniref:9306_t:CDS:1 n=1 Tax=Acaulospora colombiana TaxID=27376 RepID=A0ACA9KLF1_9GLOM|nr:9306_t:CDS:2 [Acaulospora colombiana]